VKTWASDAIFQQSLEMTMKYKVSLEKTDEGYSVHCPGLPGCWSQGQTEGEALENIAEAIGDYLIAVREESKPAQLREVEVAV